MLRITKKPEDPAIASAALLALVAAVVLYVTTNLLKERLGCLVGLDDFFSGVSATFVCTITLWQFASGRGADNFRAWWLRVVVARALPVAEMGKEAKDAMVASANRYVVRKGWKPLSVIAFALLVFAQRIIDAVDDFLGAGSSSRYDAGGFGVGVLVGLIILFVWARRLQRLGRTGGMHPCPCCGYRTLPGRGDYDLCPVCWWEDEGLEPWEFSGPNGQTLVHAQHEYVSDDRPYRQREGKVRAHRKKEARDPDWQPLERTPALVARADQAEAEHEREYEEDHRRFAEQIAADTEGSMKEYNAAVAVLQAQASGLPYREVKTQLREISSTHSVPWPAAHLELRARLMTDEHYYRGHPLRTLSWMVRYSRPRTYRQRWQEVRTGTFYFAFAR